MTLPTSPASDQAAGRLALLAAALGEPDLQIQLHDGASRWRGRAGTDTALQLAPGQPPRQQRLQLLRHLLDGRPGGRRSSPHVVAALADRRLPALLRRLFLWLDGQRIDRLLVQRFPGAAADPALDPPPPLLPGLAACQPAAAATDADSALELARHWHATLRAGRPNRRSRTLAGIDDDRCRLLHVRPASGPGDGDGAAPGGQGMAGDGGGSSHRGAGGSAHQRPASSAPVGRQDSANPATPGATPTTADGSGANKLRSVRRAGRAAAGPHTTLHDEWDHRLQAHRRHWTAVHERRLRGSDLQFMAGLQARFPGLLRRIRRRFASLRADAPQRARRLRDGDALDLDAALDAQVARRAAPLPADDRVYQARPLRQRALSVALLLDMSSSTGYPIPAPPGTATPAPEPDDVLWQVAGSRLAVDSTPRRRVIDVVRDATALLCEALQAMGDRHAVFGFSGQGRLNVDCAVIKDFADPWGPPQAAALAAVQPQGATRTGAAVRHAVHRLRAEPSRRRLLIVLSDGYPQDSDYGDGPDALQHGLQDTAQALREAERAGVACFQLSVDAAANDYLRRISPKHRYWVLDEVNALPARMLALARLLAAPG